MVSWYIKICSEQDKYHKCLIGLKYCCVDWTYHTYRTSGDQRCTFLCSSGCNFQCLLLQIKFCTLSHILTLLHHQYIYKTVSSATDYFTFAQHSLYSEIMLLWCGKLHCWHFRDHDVTL